MKTSFPVDTTVSTTNLRSLPAQGSQYGLQGAFFADKNLTTIYSFGAFQDGNDTTEISTLETFNAISQKWSNTTVSGGSFNGLSRSFSSSATTATSGLGLSFITGGLDVAAEPQGMIRFDASNPDSVQWRNETQDVPHMVGATMQYARFGIQGVLIVTGGYLDVSLPSVFLERLPTKTF